MTESTAFPENIEAERIVISALLRSGAEKGLLLRSLTREDFFYLQHRQIFEAAAAIAQSGGEVDLSSVATRCYEEKNGVTFSSLLEYSEYPEIHGIEQHIGILREKARLRKIGEFAEEIQRRVARSDDSASLVESLRAIGDKVSFQNGDAMRSVSGPIAVVQQIGLNEFLTPKHIPGIETPIPWLSERLRFTPKSVTVLAALPACGKSALALQCALEAARRRHLTHFYTLEMSKEEVVSRAIAILGGVNMARLESGHATAEERQRALDGYAQLAELDEYLRICDRGALTLLDVERDLRDQQAKGLPIGFVVVDYLQLLSTLGRTENRNQEVGSNARRFKVLMQDYGAAGLLLSQFSRAPEKENRKPRISDLRESGEIEQHASNVLLLHPEKQLDQGDMQVWCSLAKKRGGALGDTSLRFVRRYTRFEEMF